MCINDKLRKLFFFTFIIVVLLSVFITIVTILAIEEKECTLYVDRDLILEHPLILKPDVNEFILPESNGRLRFKIGERIMLGCTGEENYFLFGKHEKEKTIQCIKKDLFISLSDNDIGLFKDFRCNVYPKSIIKRTNTNCSENSDEIEIGFEVSTGFINIMTTCFNKKTKDSLYSTFTISGNINGRQKVKPKFDFEDDKLYQIKEVERPDLLYSIINQKYVVYKHKIWSTKVEEFINGTHHLNRGHLTAKADYIYNSQQMATCHYINVAPQWKNFNSGNWNELEIYIRTFVDLMRQDYIIYTGVWGILEIGLSYNKFSLYLEDDKKTLTVPKIFWKIIYDPRTNTSAAFVGHNDPYNDVTKPICPDMCNKILTNSNIKLNWKPTDLNQGYSYCCTYEDLKKVVKYLPELNEPGLLSM